MMEQCEVEKMSSTQGKENRDYQDDGRGQSQSDSLNSSFQRVQIGAGQRKSIAREGGTNLKDELMCLCVLRDWYFVELAKLMIIQEKSSC